MSRIEPYTNTLCVGDCIPLLGDMPAASVALAFADPPFNIGYKYDVYDDSRDTTEYIDWSANWLRAVYRVLDDTGTFWLAIGSRFVSELDVLAKAVGFYQRAHVIWHYTFGVNCTKTFTPSHTHLLYYTKSKKHFTFNADAVRVPSARQMTYQDPRANPQGRLPDSTWILRPQEVPEAFHASFDTWHIPRIAGTFKQRVKGAPNQMPEQLLGRIVRACSNPADYVLDPFAGTATTLVVAKKLDRRYVGMELSADYAAAATARLARVNIGEALDGPIPQGG